MAFNGILAIILLYFSECGFFFNQLQLKSDPYCLRQKCSIKNLVLGNNLMTRDYRLQREHVSRDDSERARRQRKLDQYCTITWETVRDRMEINAYRVYGFRLVPSVTSNDLERCNESNDHRHYLCCS